MSAATELADAVKDALNAAFSDDFTATRKYIPRLVLEEVGTDLSVQVVPKSDDRLLNTRGGSVLRDIPIDIGIQKKLAGGANPDTEGINAEVDALMSIVESIADFLRPGTAFTITGSRRGIIFRTVVDPIYLPDHLTQFSVFTSVVTATLRLP